MARHVGDTASVISQQTATSSGTRSIYPRGPQLSLDTFASKDFIVKDFVESLSEGTALSSRRSYDTSRSSGIEAFDPKPYIRTFEHAFTRLSQLSEQRESHESELSLAVRRAEAQHRQHCTTLQRKLDQALESFNSLERKLENTLDQGQTNGHGSQTNDYSSATRAGGALHVGERLQELDRQRRRAEDAKFLIQCWQDVSQKGDLSRLEEQRRMGGGDGKVKCARIARQLLRISEQLDVEPSSVQMNGLRTSNGDYAMNGNGQVNENDHLRSRRETNEIIERFLERLETDLLEQFDSCKRQHNEQGMKECAVALFDFHEGASVISRYVNGHELFLERSHLLSDPVSDDSDLWDRLADPDAESPGLEQSLQSLIEEVRLVIEEESRPIKHVFHYSEQVLITFLQRVFQQTIQQRLEIVLEKAESVSLLAFLRTLQAARSLIGSMIESLKSHGLTEHPDPASINVAAILDQQLEVLFVPYIAGASYIERERQSLEELYASLLYRFTLYHSRRRKNPSGYLGTFGQRGKELLSSARDLYTDRLNSSELGNSQKAILLRLAGMRDTDQRQQAADMEVSDEDGALSLPMAKRMLKWLAEAVGRGLELSGGTETPKDVAIMLRLLLTNLCDIYLDTALDTAAEVALSQENVKTEPDMSFVHGLRNAVYILSLQMSISQNVLLPLASSNVTTKRELEKQLSMTISRMEDKISTIRSRIIEVTLNWVAKLLRGQNRTDFRPRDEAFGLEQLQTSTCNSIFVFVSRIRDLNNTSVDASGSSANRTPGRNQETFFTELAVGLRSQLFDHFKRYQVNLAGGLMVSKDIHKYIELLRTFPLAPGFIPSLEILVEVGNIFVIGPEALRDRLRGGGVLMGVDKQDLRPYILRREDVNTIGVQSVLNAL